MTRTSTSTTTTSIIRAFAKGLKGLVGHRLKRILLIGSYARGDYTAESDIDIVLVLTTTDKTLRDKIYDYLVDFELENDVDISLKILDRGMYRKWKELGEPFVREVENEGIAL